MSSCVLLVSVIAHQPHDALFPNKGVHGVGVVLLVWWGNLWVAVTTSEERAERRVSVNVLHPVVSSDTVAAFLGQEYWLCSDGVLSPEFVEDQGHAEGRRVVGAEAVAISADHLQNVFVSVASAVQVVPRVQQLHLTELGKFHLQEIKEQ